ncbi:serine/threonine protein kinase [Nannizzia gypsea CBS 118893]|uniref:Serine/threonine protein kinase n=1 Tax=Arthroderma gypseum (strain ATCC MYA-4604 / CBS 118893) TaxID=535722 RepID=E5R2B6_ARTGP|nr:serine/threonine protein kinase [Nannizzia gypsea CBS 118893]EFQ97006.1 serine/threonine protein kinase [Nannizzia gypsea CBS 118893]
MEFPDLRISEVVFKETLSIREYCALFIVEIRGLVCVMKVHLGHNLNLPEDSYYETNMFVCESNAYRRLNEAGPFYGTIENIDPKLCLPYLNKFVDDKYRPTAIFIEYIPNMKELHRSNYTPERMRNFVEGLKEIHKAMVMHGDIHPRNMMIVEDDPSRAIWLDFDRAQALSPEPDELHKKLDWVGRETRLIMEMAEDMVCSPPVICLLFYESSYFLTWVAWKRRRQIGLRRSVTGLVNTMEVLV